MTVEIGIIILLVGALAYMAGLLRERNVRIGMIERNLALTEQTAHAYHNRLLDRIGIPVVFDEKGDIIANPVFQDTSAPVIMKPPFAAAEEQWEREEEERRNSYPTAAGLGIIPDLPDSEKDRLRAEYSLNHQP